MSEEFQFSNFQPSLVRNCRSCGGRGQNLLGETLMQIREELRGRAER